MSLKRAGFFRELRHSDDLPSLKSALADAPQNHEQDIVDYLRSGALLIGSPGPSFDVLSSTRQVAGAQHILTDGTWAWPADISYYVEKYHCRLPREFIDHMRSRNWRPPDDAEIDPGSLTM
jgi:hypothetical protein